MDKYEEILKGKVTPLEELEDLERGQRVTVAGVVSSLKVKKTRNGTYMAVFNLIDKSAIAEVVVFPDLYEREKEKVQEDTVLVLTCVVDEDLETEEVKLVAEDIHKPEDFVKNGKLKIIFKKEDVMNGKALKLKRFLERFKGKEGVDIIFEIVGEDFTAQLQPPSDIKLPPSPEVMNFIKRRLKLQVTGH